MIRFFGLGLALLALATLAFGAPMCCVLQTGCCVTNQQAASEEAETERGAPGTSCLCCQPERPRDGNGAGEGQPETPPRRTKCECDHGAEIAPANKSHSPDAPAFVGLVVLAPTAVTVHAARLTDARTAPPLREPTLTLPLLL